MKNGKYCNKKSLNMKPLALLLALTLLVGCVVGGTIAWLTAQTGTVTNTFTVGDINIALNETTGNDYHFVPGDKLAKDPKATVLANSENCYLFVKVTVTNNKAEVTVNNEKITADPVIDFKIADGWIFYKDANGNTTAPANFKNGTYYFYREVGKTDADKPFYIIKGGDKGANGEVTVSTNVVKEMLTGNDGLSTKKPVIAFQAAAIQMDNVETLTEAWNNLPSAFKG